VREEIEGCHALITLCSFDSLTRPWVNFEVGAAWMINKPNIPVCHKGLTPADLPVPLSLYQALAIDDPRGLTRLYTTLAGWFGCKVPSRNFEELAREARGVVGDAAARGVAAAAEDAAATGLRADVMDDAVARRLHAALSEPNPKWRTITWAAAEAGVSEDIAHKHFLTDDAVRFSKSKSSGARIVGLKRRVGERSVLRGPLDRLDR
jgi:hypothetical protein